MGGLPTLIPSKRTKTIRKKILEKAGKSKSGACSSRQGEETVVDMESV
jgi:hypothetical protein